MFNFFKKKKETNHSFPALDNYKNKDKYFRRTLQWDWLDEKMIHVLDHKSEKPRMITMDPWPQQVFLDADGTKTVSEYILHMASLYSKNSVPKSLDNDIIEVLKNLIDDSEIIKLYNEPKQLPYYLELPRSKQDSDKAHQLMLADGFIKKDE